MSATYATMITAYKYAQTSCSEMTDDERQKILKELGVKIPSKGCDGYSHPLNDISYTGHTFKQEVVCYFCGLVINTKDNKIVPYTFLCIPLGRIITEFIVKPNGNDSVYRGNETYCWSAGAGSGAGSSAVGINVSTGSKTVTNKRDYKTAAMPNGGTAHTYNAKDLIFKPSSTC